MSAWLIVIVGSSVALGFALGRVGRDEDRTDADTAWRRQRITHLANIRLAHALRRVLDRPSWLPEPHRRGWRPDPLKAAGAREQMRRTT